jgi:hypothetical protein
MTSVAEMERLTRIDGCKRTELSPSSTSRYGFLGRTQPLTNVKAKKKGQGKIESKETRSKNKGKVKSPLKYLYHSGCQLSASQGGVTPGQGREGHCGGVGRRLACHRPHLTWGLAGRLGGKRSWRPERVGKDSFLGSLKSSPEGIDDARTTACSSVLCTLPIFTISGCILDAKPWPGGESWAAAACAGPADVISRCPT